MAKEKTMNKITVKVVPDFAEFERAMGQMKDNMEERVANEHKKALKNKKTDFPKAEALAKIETLTQNKASFTISEKVNHPNGKNYNMKDYGASYSVNIDQLTLEKGIEILEMLQEIIDEKKKKDEMQSSVAAGSKFHTFKTDSKTPNKK